MKTALQKINRIAESLFVYSFFSFITHIVLSIKIDSSNKLIKSELTFACINFTWSWCNAASTTRPHL